MLYTLLTLYTPGNPQLCTLLCVKGLPVAQLVKNLSAIQETQVQFLGQEDLLEKEMATHSSILAWRIPWTRSLRDYSPWGHEESDTTEAPSHARIADAHRCTPETNTTL